MRLPKGEHKITIGFVNVANRIKTEIGNVLVTPSSDCFLVPVEGDLVVNVPSKGLYFFNLYLNDELVGSSVLAFEDDDPKFSYNLYDDDIQRIKNGEYLALMKRSQQRKTL